MRLVLPGWAWIVALVASFVLGLAFQMPLRVALRLAGVGDLLLNTTVDGTLLSWHATRADGLQARFDGSLLRLLGGRYAGDLELSRGTARFHGTVTRRWDGAIVIDDGELAADVAPLAGALALPPSMIDGRLAVHGIHAVWRAEALVSLACAGEVSGVRAGPGADAIAIGDLDIECADSAGGPIVSVADRGGPLVFHSAIRFAVDGRFMVEGTASTRPGAPADLVDALPLLGREAGPGRISFRYMGALPRLAPR